MWCIKCGKELPDEANFCTYCGAKVSDSETNSNRETNLPADDEPEVLHEAPSENATDIEAQSTAKRTFGTSIKEKLVQIWRNLSIFGKGMTVAVGVSTLFFLVAILFGRSVAATISFIQIVLLAISWLMKREKIKVKNKRLYIILLILAIVLTVPYFLLFSSADKVGNENMIPVTTETTIAELPNLEWPVNELTSLLPVPVSQIGFVQWNNPGDVSIYLGDTRKEAFAAYISACAETGFTTVSSQNEVYYEATNGTGHRLALTFLEEGAMTVDIKEPLYTIQLELDCVPNLIFSKYDVDVEVNGIKLGTLEHGSSDIFQCELTQGIYTVKAINSEDSTVTGTAEIEVHGSLKVNYKISCHSSEINLTEEFIESMEPLQNGQVKVPSAAEDYRALLCTDVVSELQDAGFTNISSTAIRDLDESHASRDGNIEEISIDGKTDFRRAEIFEAGVEVAITYHTMAPTLEEIQEKITNKSGTPADEILLSFEDTGYTVVCSVVGKEVEDFKPDGYIFESGWLESNEKVAHLDFTTEEFKLMQSQLEEFFPLENAQRASVVGLTNCYANDVFTADGSTYVPSKFHSYDDISGFYLSVTNNGTWTAVDEDTWHVDELRCIMSGGGAHLKASLDVSFDSTNYLISNVDTVIGSEDNIASNNTAALSIEHLEPADNRPYLTVAPKLIQKERDSTAEQDTLNRTTPTAERTAWIENQFSFWDGHHKELEKLIKKNLNNEKSYEHINTTYIDISSEELQKEMNKNLQGTGYKVEIGDLLVICEFSAKNAFNATVKNTAIGIVRYGDDSVILVGIG